MKNSDSFFLWLAEYTVHRQMYISSKLWIIWKFAGINLKTKTHNFPQNRYVASVLFSMSFTVLIIYKLLHCFFIYILQNALLPCFKKNFDFGKCQHSSY